MGMSDSSRREHMLKKSLLSLTLVVELIVSLWIHQLLPTHPVESDGLLDFEVRHSVYIYPNQLLLFEPWK